MEKNELKVNDAVITDVCGLSGPYRVLAVGPDIVLLAHRRPVKISWCYKIGRYERRLLHWKFIGGEQ